MEFLKIRKQIEKKILSEVGIEPRPGAQKQTKTTHRRPHIEYFDLVP